MAYAMESKWSLLSLKQMVYLGEFLQCGKRDYLKVEHIQVSKHFILSKGAILDNPNCVIINVYAPNDVVERRGLWDEWLISLASVFFIFILKMGSV